jgi:hypothetical protein
MENTCNHEAHVSASHLCPCIHDELELAGGCLGLVTQRLKLRGSKLSCILAGLQQHTRRHPGSTTTHTSAHAASPHVCNLQM